MIFQYRFYKVLLYCYIGNYFWRRNCFIRLQDAFDVFGTLWFLLLSKYISLFTSILKLAGKKFNYFVFGWGEGHTSLSPQMAHKLCSFFLRCICNPVNGRGSFGNEADAVERTSVIWLETMINHVHNPQNWS